MLMSKPRSLKLLLACLMAVGFFLPATLTAQAADSATVNGVKVSNGKSGVLNIDVQATAPVRFKSTRPSDKLVVVDVFPAVLDPAANSTTNVNNGLVENVSLSQQSSDTVRVSIKVLSQPEFTVVPGAANRGVCVAVSSVPAKDAKVTAAPEAKKTEVKTVAEAKPVVEKKEAKPVAQKAPAAKKAAAKAAPAVKTTSTSAVRKTKPVPKAKPEKTVNLELVNADLIYVIKYLAKEMGRNIFVAPDVAGSVTVTLNKVRPEGALALILKMQANEYDYKIVDNTIIVATPDKLATIADNILTPKTKSSAVRKNLVDQEFLLESAPAAKVTEFLKTQYPDVIFTAHPTMNGFYAKGTVAELREIKSKIPNLDQVPAAPASARREYIPVNYGTLSDVQALVKQFVPDAQVIVDSRLNLLIVEGTDSDIEQVEEVLANIDKPLDQVMLDVKVVDLAENGSKDLGITWSDISGTMGTFSTTFAEVVPGLFYNEEDHMITNDQANLDELASFNIGAFGRMPFLLKAQMQMKIETGDAKVLASPRVATLSGTEAEIHVGEKYPIVYFDNRAGQYQVNYIPIGTNVTIKPEIKSDGYIIAEINPSVTSMITLINNQYPETTDRTVKTKLRVKDGDTIVIGGLVNDEERESVTKLPLFGDLPIIGALFRTSSVSTKRNEVVMMLTPHIMR